MQELRLVAANERGTHLVLRSPDGDRFLLCVDERLRAAARGDRSRFTPNEGESANDIRPREIQARIRSGFSAEQVARAAGVPVERVRRFEGPVLAEREHMAGQAQRSTVRRVGLDARPASLLDVLTDRLTPLAVQPDELGWDSWRRDDGRWVIQVAYTLDEATVVARFLYDPRARSVVPEDEEARWLIGEIEHRPGVTPPARIDDVEERRNDRRERRLTPRRPNERPRPAAPPPIVPVQDLIEAPVTTEPPPQDGPTPEPAVIAAAMRSAIAAAEQDPEPALPARRGSTPMRRPAVGMDVPLPVEFPEAEGPTSVPGPPAVPAAAAASAVDPVIEAEAEPIARTGTDNELARPARNRRASVPAWDEIMFGARRSE